MAYQCRARKCDAIGVKSGLGYLCAVGLPLEFGCKKRLDVT